VAGELYIGGVGVARGYLNRPQLSGEHFMTDPFCGTPGAVMYRSGDFARWRSDGQIDFIGRLDHQVKLRGFRIELGEIEARIARHPDIRQVVVLAREDIPGDRRLAAYVVAANPPADLVDQLRKLLRADVPEHMVPAHFVLLDALPVTPNGKVDRRRLPVPERSAVERVAYMPARTPIEEILAGTWAEVLGVERVGIDDNFFELGGHSLLATRVVARVRQLLSVELPMRDLFVAPTISSLAVRIEALRTARRPALALDALAGAANAGEPGGATPNREEIEL
jgi:acyl carrier protein